MNTALLLIAFLSGVGSFAQGTIYFSTFVPEKGVFAPVMLESPFGSYGSERGNLFGYEPGPAFSAGLFLQGLDGSLTLIPSSLTKFQARPNAYYVEPVMVEIPGSPPGSAVTLVMRAWPTSGFNYNGSSGALVIQNLGDGMNSPAYLPSSFTGFIFIIPEPSVISFCLLGCAIFFAARRTGRRSIAPMR